MARVSANGGTTEATDCVTTKLQAIDTKSLLQSATFALIPSGIKAGTVFAEVPNSGNGDLTFTRTTAATNGVTRVNSGSVIENVPPNTPRIDYSQGGCPNLLLEPQRRNLLKYSQDYSQSSAWGKTDTTVNQTAIVAPDNTITGNLVTETLAVSSGLYQDITSSITVFPVTIYLKYGTQDWVRILISDSSVPNNNVRQWINIQTGVLGTSQANGSGTAISDASISSVNGWYKITFKASFTGAAGYTYQTMSAASNGSTLRGSAGNTRYEWGKMIEDSGSSSVSYPTSYIPTTSGAATRNAESFTRNSVYTNNIIGSSGGTWFVEVKNNISIKGDATSNYYGLYIGDSSSSPNNSICVYNDNTTNLLKIGTRASGTTTARYTTAAASIKLIIRFDGSFVNAWSNGTQVITNLSFTHTLSTFEYLAGINTDVSKYISQMALWNTPLSDAQCIALTS